MLVWKKILWLRERIREQEIWIERCGGSLVGYIAHYGDPGVPPLDSHGTPLTFKLTEEQQKLFDDLQCVPGLPGTFYKKHSGDGGTAIYNADYNRLLSFQRELADLETKYPSARRKAEMANC